MPPPGRVWVPGSWREVRGGWQWTHGFWQEVVQAQQTELDETMAELRKMLDQELDPTEVDRQADIPRNVIDGLGRVLSKVEPAQPFSKLRGNLRRQLGGDVLPLLHEFRSGALDQIISAERIS